MFKIHRTAIILASAAAVIGIGAAPAFASGPSTSSSQTVQVNVQNEISITGLNATVNLSANQELMGAETYYVTSNDGLGYTLNETAGGANFVLSGSSYQLPDSAWNIAGSVSENCTPGAPVSGVVTCTNGTGAGGISGFSPSTTSHQAFSSTTVGSDLYTENWTVTVPQNAPAGSYQNSLTYLALGN